MEYLVLHLNKVGGLKRDRMVINHTFPKQWIIHFHIMQLVASFSLNSPC